MKKQEYLELLKGALTKLKVADIDDIIGEYESHFDFKLADGYSEEEIVAKLGAPNIVAGQYAVTEGTTVNNRPNAPMIYIGLVTADIGAGAFFAFLGAWVAVLGGSVLVFLGAGFALIFNLQASWALLPHIPYFNGLLLSLPLLSAAVLSAVGTVYCSLYLKQLFKAYARWHTNNTAIAGNKPVLPSISKHPQLKPKTKRFLRNTLVISLICLGITLIIGYVAAAISSGAFEFWHAWNWFQ